jgi:glycine cleavage system aminomethyltransferase T
VTEHYGCLSMMGPLARDVLMSVTQTDVSNETFPFGACREIEIAGAKLRALRITYVGELGFELHVPAEGIERVYATLTKAGEVHGIADAGYRAIESLRLEKAYRAWGADISADTTPDEAGLSFALRKDLGRAFLGRDALLAKRKAPLARRLAIFTVDDPKIVLLGRETIIRNGEAVGWLTSGGWGYTVATNIGLGYVRSAKGVTDEFLAAGDYRLEVAGEEIEARFHARPLYDPKGLRPRG